MMKVKRTGRTALVTCGAGECVGDPTTRRLLGVLDELLGQDVDRIVVDLSAVRLADTPFVASLVDFFGRARALNVAVEFHPSDAVEQILRVSRLEGILPLTMPEA